MFSVYPPVFYHLCPSSICNDRYMSLHMCQNTECTTPRMDLKVNYGIRVAIIKKCTTLAGALIIGEEQAVYQKSLDLSLNLRTPLKLF